MNLKFLKDRKNWEKLLFVYRHNSLNLSMEKAYAGKDEQAKVFGFYHAYCMCDGWEKLVKEQLSHIKESGLYDRLDTLYIGALINEEQLRVLNAIVQEYPKMEILYTDNDGSVLEFRTLIELQKKCYSDKFLGFYFHTKGVTWINADRKIYNVGNSWRLMNEHFLFDKWRIAIHALNEGYDLYGTNYQEIFNDKYRLLGMNFFWFNSEYVAKLSKLYIAKDCRNISEVWICSKTHNVYCPFEFSGNSRNNAVPKEFYTEFNPFRRFLLTIKVYISRFNFWFKLLGGSNNQVNPNVKKQRALNEDDFKYLNSERNE